MSTSSRKAVLYLRVSTDEQVENFSLDTQQEICTREAKHRGYTIDKVFREEGRSAKTIKGRSILIELLEYCQKNKKEISAVIYYKTDRLSRQIFDYLIIQQKLSKLEIKLISATEPIDDTPMGKFLGNFFAQIAQFDNDVRSERARNGMRSRFKSGLFSGHPPIGYISIDGIVLEDEKNFTKIKAAWNLMATGTKTLNEITQIMNSWGIHLRPQTASRIFRSKFYAGILFSPTYQEEVRGQHIPMITREQFNTVQTILDGRNTRKPPLSRRNRLHPDFPLRRLLRCGRCGVPFTGAWSQGRRAKYAYYFCRQKKACRSPNVPIKHAHEALVNLLQTITITPEGEESFLLLVKNEYAKRFSIIDQQRIRHKQQLKKLHDVKKKLIQKHLSGIYSDDIFKEQNELLERNIEAIQVVTNNKFIKQYDFPFANEYIKKLISKPLCLYEAGEIGRKKDLLSFLFPSELIWNYPNFSFNRMNPLFRMLK